MRLLSPDCSKNLIAWNASFVVIMIIGLLTGTAYAAKEQVLHSFTPFGDGRNPLAGLMSKLVRNVPMVNSLEMSPF